MRVAAVGVESARAMSSRPICECGLASARSASLFSSRRSGACAEKQRKEKIATPCASLSRARTHAPCRNLTTRTRPLPRACGPAWPPWTRATSRPRPRAQRRCCAAGRATTRGGAFFWCSSLLRAPGRSRRKAVHERPGWVVEDGEGRRLRTATSKNDAPAKCFHSLACSRSGNSFVHRRRRRHIHTRPHIHTHTRPPHTPLNKQKAWPAAPPTTAATRPLPPRTLPRPPSWTRPAWTRGKGWRPPVWPAGTPWARLRCMKSW